MTEPREDILMFDRDNTLYDESAKSLFPGVEDFLREQCRQRLCVLVTSGKDDEAADISAIRPFFDGEVWDQQKFRPKSPYETRRTIGTWESSIYGFLELPGGVFVDVADPEQVALHCDFPEARDDFRRDLKGSRLGTELNDRLNDQIGALTVMMHKPTGQVLGNLHQVQERVRLFGGKDFYMVRQTVGRGQNPRAVSIGNPEDLQYTASDPTTPHISVTLVNWTTRGRVRNLIDKLLSPGQRPAEVFDALYATGVYRSDRDFVRQLPNYCDEGKVVRIDDTEFAMARPTTGLNSMLPKTLNEGRIIVEAPISL